jgi:hypothetical protein
LHARQLGCLGIVGRERDGDSRIIDGASCVHVGVKRLQEIGTAGRASTWDLDDNTCCIANAIAVSGSGWVQARWVAELGDKGGVDIAALDLDRGRSDRHKQQRGQSEEGAEGLHVSNIKFLRGKCR